MNGSGGGGDYGSSSGSNSNSNPSIFERLRQLDGREASDTAPSFEQTKPRQIDEKIRARKIENDIAEADQKLKVKTLFILFAFLSIETLVVFMLAFFQGLETHGFHMEEWSFRVVIGATIGQITAMLTIAVQHLFPKKERH